VAAFTSLKIITVKERLMGVAKRADGNAIAKKKARRQGQRALKLG
jgi:hypothetical protein